MPDPKLCPKCGKALAAQDSESFCPACIMRFGLDSGTAPTNHPRGRAFIPPTTEELSQFFPSLEIIGLLGRGGMGAVYKVRQKQLDRIAALKILPPDVAEDPSFAKRFEREAQALAKLNHPNIVTLYEFGKADGLYFFLMEFVDGVNLRQLMSSGKIEPKEALAIVPQICEALQFAHDKGIVHRDIKPENLLLDKTGRIKIADFGIAKILDASDAVSATDSVSEAQPEISAAAGTPQYMAPEQKAQQHTDHRTDIYSLGVVFYELLTGELPGANLQPPSQKVQIDVRLDEIVLRALESKPEHRYQTVNALRKEVETLKGAPVVLPVEGDASSSPSRFSRLAIVGACWVPIFLFGSLAILCGVDVSSGELDRRLWLQALVIIAVGGIAITAPLATTILGWISVTQIRRSAGRLHGLGLAVFDGLFFPLLALDALIVAIDLSGRQHVTGPGLTPGVTMAVLYIPGWQMLLVLALIVAVDWLIIRAVWRAVSLPLAGDQSSIPPAAPRPMNRTAIAVGFTIMMLATFGTQTLLNHLKRGDQVQVVTLNAPHTTARAMDVTLTFGPVIERGILFDDGYINFQSGKVFKHLVPNESNDDIKAWHRQNKIGARAESWGPPSDSEYERFPRLASLFTTFVRENTDTFESAKPSDAEARLKVAEKNKSVPWGYANGLKPWWFRTHDGVTGMVQITGSTTRERPHELTIRYKLVQDAHANTAQSPKLKLEKALLLAMEKKLSATAVGASPENNEFVEYEFLGVDVAKDLHTAKIGIAGVKPWSSSRHKELWVRVPKGEFAASDEGNGLWIVTGMGDLGVLQFEFQIAEVATKENVTETVKPAVAEKPADPLIAIELQIAQRQLEKALAELQDAQIEASLGPNKSGLNEFEQKAAESRAKMKVQLLQERAMRLREQINRSVPKNEPAIRDNHFNVEPF